MKVYFSNNGCSIENEDFIRFLRLSHNEQTNNIFSAEAIVVRFCGMSTESFEEIPQDMAFYKELKRRNPKIKLFIGGCATEALNLKKRYPWVDGVFSRRHIVEDLAKYWHYDPASDDKPVSFLNSVRIQSGCMRRCGFCKQGYMNMPLQSKPIDRIIQDIIYANSGFVTLLSENSTEFGLDFPGKIRLIDLLKQIESIDSVNGYTLTGLCIDELVGNEELVEFLKNSPKFFQLQLEIQSLIPEVRKNMRLTSSVEEVVSLMQEFAYKNIVTNIMLGYPGETDENFETELNLIKKMNMYYVQINVYDDTPGVYGHKFKQIPKETTKKRESMLLKTLTSLRQEKAKELIKQSMHTPIPCIYASGSIALTLNASATVQINNLNKNCLREGQLIEVQITRMAHPFDVFSSNQDLTLEGEIVYEGN